MGCDCRNAVQRVRRGRMTGLALSGMTALLVNVTGAIAPANSEPMMSHDAFNQADMREAMLAQEPLAKAAHIVRETIERSSIDGFAGFRFENGEVVLRWKGRIYPKLQAAIRDASRIATVRIESVSFTYAELRKEALRYSPWVRSETSPAAPLLGVSYTDRGTIRLETLSDADVAALCSALPKSRFPVEIAAATRMPVTAGIASMWKSGEIRSGPTGDRAAHFPVTDSDSDTFEVYDMVVDLYNSVGECPATKSDSGGPAVTSD